MAVRPAGAVTFLFTDIEGSTPRWERQPDAMRAELAEHDGIVRATIAAAGGEVVKHTGDGFMAVFADPVAAVGAAVECQRGLAGRVTLRSRIGLHTAPAAPTADDYFGPGPNRAARVMAAARAGRC